VRLESVELRRIRLPLVAPFRTSLGTERERDVLLVRVVGPDSEGWGECVAFGSPFYSYEYVDGAHDVIRRHLLPRLFARGEVAAEEVAPVLGDVRGHPMAKGGPVFLRAPIQIGAVEQKIHVVGILGNIQVLFHQFVLGRVSHISGGDGEQYGYQCRQNGAGPVARGRAGPARARPGQRRPGTCRAEGTHEGERRSLNARKPSTGSGPASEASMLIRS